MGLINTFMQTDLLAQPWRERLGFVLRGQRHAVVNVAVWTGEIGTGLLGSSVVARVADATDNRDFHWRLPLVNAIMRRRCGTALSRSGWDDKDFLTTRTSAASSQVC